MESFAHRSARLRAGMDCELAAPERRSWNFEDATSVDCEGRLWHENQCWSPCHARAMKAPVAVTNVRGPVVRVPPGTDRDPPFPELGDVVTLPDRGA